MAHRLIRIVCIGILASGGLVAMHRGTSERLASEPLGAVAISDTGDGLPSGGLLASAGQKEIRTPERVQLVGPASARTGERWFHLGVGLGTAAIALAALFALRGTGSRSSRAISVLCLVPAGWALWSVSTEGGPVGATALASMEAFWAYAPVFVASLLLGVAFRLKATT